jgi:hypothetical protein
MKPPINADERRYNQLDAPKDALILRCFFLLLSAFIGVHLRLTCFFAFPWRPLRLSFSF